MSTFKVIKAIKGISCCSNNGLYQIDSDRVIIGSYNKICIVNIDKGSIESEIKDNKLGAVRCFIKLRDNKTILCGCDKGMFCLLDLNTKEYTLQENNSHTINDILSLSQELLISCSDDKTIKIWKY